MNYFRKKTSGLILVWTGIIIVVVTMFLVFSSQNKMRIQKQNENYMKDNTVQAASQINDVLTQALGSIEDMAYWYGKNLKKPEVTAEELAELTRHSSFDYIRYTSADGVNLAADGRTNSSVDRDYYIEGMKGKTGVSVTLVSRITQETIVNFYTPLRYKGEIIGVLRGVYRANKRMKKLLNSSYFGVSASSFLCMSDGRIIASGNEKKLPINLKSYLEDETIVDKETAEKIRRTYETGEACAFSFKDNGKNGNGYMLRLESRDWFLIQTFPPEVTDSMFMEANKAGIFLEISVIILFLSYIIFIIVRNRRQNRKLLSENRDMNYVIHGVPQLFERFALVDLEEDSYRYMLDNKPRKDRIPEKGSYPLLVAHLLDNIKEEKVKEQLYQIIAPEAIRHNCDENGLDYKIEYQSTDGEEEWRRLAVVCLERKKGVPVKVLIAKQDISDVKKEEIMRQTALKNAFQTAESANRAKSDFLSRMSHDIRTPMNAIMGMTQLAQIHLEEPERVKDCLEKIGVSSRHLLGIINEVLDMSKIESGKISLAFEEFTLEGLLCDLFTMFEPQMQEKNQTFVKDIQEPVHKKVCGDASRLSQVLANVLGNAVKFTPEGGRISFAMREKESGVKEYACYEFVIEDNGRGMTQEFVKKIFEPFEREKDLRKDKIEGTGLGMAIAKSIVTMMNGNIRVDSVLEKGSCFTITVFLHLAGEESISNELLKEEKEESEASREVSGDGWKDTFKGKKALLVEDNEINREIATELLEISGMEVASACDGEEAVIHLLNTPSYQYDVIFMDIQMPKMNGHEATKAIRASGRPDLEKIPIIAMSANAFEEDVRKSKASGMNYHIAKPVETLKLKKVLEKVFFEKKTGE